MKCTNCNKEVGFFEGLRNEFMGGSNFVCDSCAKKSGNYKKPEKISVERKILAVVIAIVGLIVVSYFLYRVLVS